MTKITKYLRNLEELKKELEENPENIKYYIGYMGFNSEDDRSIDFINEKIKEYKNKQNESTKN
jgi:hypothetical protein